MKKPQVNRAFVVFMLLGICAIAASTFGGYYFWKYQQTQIQTSAQQTGQNDENTQLLTRIRSMIEVPEDEEPTIASVTDREKLKSQQFFANAQNGDRVFIFSNAKKAILFRPSSGKIIDVAPINIGSQPAAPVTKHPTFVLLNGTTTVGLTKKYETELKAKIPEVQVLDRDNAKDSYEKSIFVNVSGSTKAGEYASLLGFTLAPLPDGESSPSSDFLIILGSDKK